MRTRRSRLARQVLFAVGMHRTRRRRAQRGLMLIEILVVVTIIGMIAGIVGVSVVGVMRDSQVKTAKTQISNLRNGMEMYRLKFHRYPTSGEGLERLVNPPSGDKIIDNVPQDPWGEPYVLASPGQTDKRSFDIYSKGPDNQADTEDDVR